MVYDTLEAEDAKRPVSFASDPEADPPSGGASAAPEDDSEKAYLESLLLGYDSPDQQLTQLPDERQVTARERQITKKADADLSPRPSFHVVSEDGPDHADLSDEALGSDDRPPQEDPKELIAQLRKRLAEKDKALLEASLNNVDLQQALDDSKKQSDDLEQKLVVSLKASESAAKAVEQAASTKGNWRSDADAARMEQQFRIAQKALEKEYARVREELVLTKGELHRAQQQAEAQARSRRVEAAHASAKIATLERQVTETATAASAAGAELNQRGAQMRWWLGAAATALAILIIGFLSWAGLAGSRTAPAAAAHVETAPAPEIHAAKYVSPPVSSQVSNAQLINSQFGGGSQAAFSRALNHLNNSLSAVSGRSPEQLLSEIRQKRSSTDPQICNFAWNGGQPALIYSGSGGISLDAALNNCASAVDDYVSSLIAANAPKSSGH